MGTIVTHVGLNGIPAPGFVTTTITGLYDVRFKIGSYFPVFMITAVFTNPNTQVVDTFVIHGSSKIKVFNNSLITTDDLQNPSPLGNRVSYTNPNPSIVLNA